MVRYRDNHHTLESEPGVLGPSHPVREADDICAPASEFGSAAAATGSGTMASRGRALANDLAEPLCAITNYLQAAEAALAAAPL